MGIKLSEYLKQMKEQNWRAAKRRLELRKELSEFEREFRKNMVMLITGAFAFIAALFWRDALKPLFDQFKPGTSSISNFGEILINFYAAFIVSIITVVAIVFLSRVAKGK